MRKGHENMATWHSARGATATAAVVFGALAALGGATLVGTAQAEDTSPMKDWMKKEVVAAKTAGDAAKLEALMIKLGKSVPDAKDFPKWEEYSKKAAAAAKGGNKDEINAACKACHEDYRKLFKEKYRSTPAPK